MSLGVSDQIPLFDSSLPIFIRLAIVYLIFRKNQYEKNSVMVSSFLPVFELPLPQNVINLTNCVVFITGLHGLMRKILNHGVVI